MSHSRTVTRNAPCKVNLTLDVFAPRADGFHDLDSIVVPFATPSDTVRVEVTEAAASTLRLVCDDPTLPTDEGNLAFRAARLFLDLDFQANAPPCAVTVYLTKRLPHQAGLGGGSSDAAAVLRALAYLFPGPDQSLTLQTLAAALGSDVPLFLRDAPVRMRGRGERVEMLPFPLPDLHGVLVRPAVGVPTGPAYRLLDSLPRRVPGDATARFLENPAPPTLETLADALSNDFEAAVLPAYPAVADAHQALTKAGALYAVLCGSGSAVFGLARDHAHAQSLVGALKHHFPYIHLATALHNR